MSGNYCQYSVAQWNAIINVTHLDLTLSHSLCAVTPPLGLRTSLNNRRLMYPCRWWIASEPVCLLCRAVANKRDHIKYTFYQIHVHCELHNKPEYDSLIIVLHT